MVIKLQIEKISPPVSRIRSILSQLLACTSPNLLLLGLGLAVGFPTIALPYLLNATTGLSLNESQASWFGSLPYLVQPIGAFVSGPLVDYFGRKRANFLANIPHVIAWLLMYYAWNLPSLFIANALLGLGQGVMEAPINSYVGEISEPSIRGALCTVNQLYASVGLLIIYFLGTVVDWRNAALISLSIPLCAMVLILVVPETPVWLLSQGRKKEALKSLCYLRGWTTPENVREEFDRLVEYSKKLQLCAICEKNINLANDCEHHKMNPIKRSFLKFNVVMLSKETLRPLTFIMMYFMFYVMSGLSPIRPNMANIFGAFGMSDDPEHIVLMVGIITFITSVIIIGIIKVAGKRKLGITSMLGTAVSCTLLSGYAKNHLPNTIYSYDTSTFPKETSVVPLVYFYMMAVFSGFNLAWVLLGEVFPFRSRASAQGIAAAWNYVVMFLGAKTFIDLEIHFSLWGAFAVYAAFGYIGTVYLYFFIPETEGKSLQEIECYYNGEFRTFADDPIINCFKRLKKKNTLPAT